MTEALTIALVALASGGLSTGITAWVTRRGSKDTALQAFLDDVLARVKELEASDRQHRLEIAELHTKNREIWGMWEAEREAKHKIANEAHAAALTYEAAMGDMKEAHAREVGEMRACYEGALEKMAAMKEQIAAQEEKISAQSAEIEDLKRHVERLEREAAGYGSEGGVSPGKPSDQS